MECTFTQRIDIGDPQGTQFESVEALVDTGATFTVAPAGLLRRLGVVPAEKARFRLADGRTMERELGETKIRLDGKVVSTAVVFGEEGSPTLLGAYTLERALLTVDPVHKRLAPTEGLLMVAC